MVLSGWRCMCKASNVFDLNFNGRDGAQRVSYGDVFLQAEQEYSRHNFEYADTDMLLHCHYFCLARNVRLLRESVTAVLLDFLYNGLGFLRPGDKVNADIGAGSAKSDGDSLANS